MSFSIPSIFLLSVSALSINDGLGSFECCNRAPCLGFFSILPFSNLSLGTICYSIFQSYDHFLVFSFSFSPKKKKKSSRFPEDDRDSTFPWLYAGCLCVGAMRLKMFIGMLDKLCNECRINTISAKRTVLINQGNPDKSGIIYLTVIVVIHQVFVQFSHLASQLRKPRSWESPSLESWHLFLCYYVELNSWKSQNIICSCKNAWR